MNIISNSLLCFGASLALVSNTVILFPAQAQKLPTNAQITNLRSLFRKVTQSNAVRGLPTNSQSIVKQRENFVRKWSKVNPSLAPYLGEWTNFDFSLSIYPSRVKNQVCMVISGEGKSNFYLVTLQKGVIITSDIAEDNADSDQSIFLIERGYLGQASIKSGKTKLITDNTVWHSPKMLSNINIVGANNGRQRIFQKLKSASCTNALPT